MKNIELALYHQIYKDYVSTRSKIQDLEMSKSELDFHL